MLNDLLIIVVLAIISQAVVQQIKNLLRFHKGKYFHDKINFKVLVSMIISLVLCLTYHVDLLVLLGLTASVPFVGQLITGVIISGGASLTHNLISQLLELKNVKSDE